MTSSAKKSKPDPHDDVDEATEPAPADEATPPAKPTSKRDVNAMAKDVADETRGKYEAEMVGDSTLVIRYADGTADSFTVNDITR